MRYEVTNKIWNKIRHDTHFPHASTKKIVPKFHSTCNFYRKEREISDNWEIFTENFQASCSLAVHMYWRMSRWIKLNWFAFANYDGLARQRALKFSRGVCRGKPVGYTLFSRDIHRILYILTSFCSFFPLPSSLAKCLFSSNCDVCMCMSTYALIYLYILIFIYLFIYLFASKREILHI